MANSHIPTFREIISKSVELYKLNFKRLFVLAVFITFIQQLFKVAYIKFGLIKIETIFINNGAKDAQNLANQIGGGTLLTFLVISLCIALIMLISYALFMVISNEAWQGRHISISDALKKISPRLVVLIMTSIISYIFIIAGIFLFIIPGYIIGSLLIVCMPVVLFENEKTFASIKKAIQLSSLNFIRSLAIFLMIIVLFTLPDYLLFFILGKASQLGSSLFGLDELISIAINSIILPFTSIVILGQYYALKAIYDNRMQ